MREIYKTKSYIYYYKVNRKDSSTGYVWQVPLNQKTGKLKVKKKKKLFYVNEWREFLYATDKKIVYRINNSIVSYNKKTKQKTSLTGKPVYYSSINVAKAKALKKFVEPLITKSKDDTTNSRRVVFSNLQDKIAVTELFKEISVKVADRPGGYTRIIKTGHRLGDNAEMCFIELVDYDENMAKTATAKKATRTRRSKKSAAEAPAAEVATTEEAPKAE